MAEAGDALVNGLDLDAEIKSEPIDPILDPSIIPKEFTNGLHEDSDCDDMFYFTQTEVDNTRKCLENTRLIIKDFETQLDWHLQQYMTLRNVFNPKKNTGKKDDKRQDLLSISQLSAIIANHPEGNKKFIKRKGPLTNGSGKKKRRGKDSESEDSEFSDDSEEYDEDFDEQDSEDIDDPTAKPKGKKAKGKKRGDPEIKDEIEEEEHELIEPKEEIDSDEEMEMESSPPPKKTPAKRTRKPAESKSPAKKGVGRGKKGKASTAAGMKGCSVVLDRMGEVKDEEIDRDELLEMLKSKAIDNLDSFDIDPEKPIVILKEDNVRNFDFNECETSNVVITYEDTESFPEFIFTRDVIDHIVEDAITLVQSGVFDEHLSADN